MSNVTELEKNLMEQNHQLTKTVEQLTQTIEDLNQKIAELTERLNKNSRNSSKPPSSDGLAKPAPKSLRKPSRKKAGGQKGHKGTNFCVTDKPNQVIPHMPRTCEGCPHYKECKEKAHTVEKRHVVDMVIKTEVVTHEALEVECPLCREAKRGEFPEGINGLMQYGNNLRALAIALNTTGAVSVNRVHEILGGIFGIPLSTGTISSWVTWFANHRISDAVKESGTRVAESSVSHFDETGLRVNGKLHYAHVASTGRYTYLYFSAKRGVEAMNKGGVLPGFRGVAVHDCWQPYWKYDQATHSVCCAHILRELIGVKENHPEQFWAPLFLKLLLRMKAAKERAIMQGKNALRKSQLILFSCLYDVYLRMGRKENPLPPPDPQKKKGGKPKRGKVLSLIERLAKYKGAVCLFANHFEVPFDNNQAERDLRMVKVKQKVSGCFRTTEGAEAFLTIMAYVSTAKKQGVNPFKAIRLALEGKVGCDWGAE